MKITRSSEKNILKMIVRIAVFSVILTLCFFVIVFFKGTLDLPLYQGDNIPDYDYPASENNNLPGDYPVIPDNTTVPPYNPYTNIEIYSGRGGYEGYELSDLAYNSENFKLVGYKMDIFIPLGYSYTNVGVDNSEIIPAMHPRMGFIFMTCDDGKRLIISPYGEVIIDNLLDNLVFLGERDVNRNPVFLEGENYYYFDYSSGAFQLADYDPKRDNNFVKFDYPSYYEAPKESVYKNYSRGMWGFKNIKGTTIVSAIYKGAFQYSEDYGALYDSSGRVYIYEYRGYQKFYDYRYYIPDTNGIESLGFYIFDHGLMRVRNMNIRYNGEILYDRYFVLQSNGNFMHMPIDYTIVTYSDGVFLLEKDGYYGYMSYEGRWIADPIYTYAQPFLEGLGVIGYIDGKKGVVDINGEFVLPLEYDQITNCSGGVMGLYDKDYGWFIMHKLKKTEVQN